MKWGFPNIVNAMPVDSIDTEKKDTVIREKLIVMTTRDAETKPDETLKKIS